MARAIINGKEIVFADSLLFKNLSLRELCEIVSSNYFDHSIDFLGFYIFNLSVEEDIDKDIGKSTKSIFKFTMHNGDCDEDANFVVISLKSNPKGLPLWLTESKDWAIRIDKKKRKDKK